MSEPPFTIEDARREARALDDKERPGTEIKKANHPAFKELQKKCLAFNPPHDVCASYGCPDPVLPRDTRGPEDANFHANRNICKRCHSHNISAERKEQREVLNGERKGEVAARKRARKEEAMANDNNRKAENGQGIALQGLNTVRLNSYKVLDRAQNEPRRSNGLFFKNGDGHVAGASGMSVYLKTSMADKPSFHVNHDKVGILVLLKCRDGVASCVWLYRASEVTAKVLNESSVDGELHPLLGKEGRYEGSGLWTSVHERLCALYEVEESAGRLIS